MRRFISLLGNAAWKLTKAVWVYRFTSLLVFDILWVLALVIGWTYFTTRDTPALFDLIVFVATLVVGVVSSYLSSRWGERARNWLQERLLRVVQTVNTNRPLQGGLITFIPVTIIFGLVGVGSYDWCDNFDKTEIDRNKWKVQTDPNFIDVRNDILNFVSTPEQSKGEMGGGLIARIPEDRQIEEISYTTALKSWEGNVPGGAGVGLNLKTGRDIAFKVGPNPDGEPEGEFWHCKTSSCETPENAGIGSGNYEDYWTDTSSFRKDGEDTSIRVAQTDDGIKFYIDDEPQEFRINGKRFEEATPIVGFGFTMYADEGSEFRLTVDDVCVEYADS